MQFDGPADMRGHPTAPSYRRSSVSSQFSHARVPSLPPLPHQAQPHFYGVPDLDLDIASNSGLKAGERGYHFAFDTLPRRYPDPTPGSDSVIVAGYEGGLEVYAVSKRGLDPVASLKGLRGGVYNAKILPWISSADTDADEPDVYPLVAVVVHGPVLPTASAEQDAQSAPMAGIGGARSSTPGSPRVDAAVVRGPNQLIEYYQTSVEVYSLRTSRRVDVLLQASQVPIESSVAITSHMFSPPPPTGNFHIRADANTIVVSSGLTGECWLYRQLPPRPGASIGFGCAAKFWTSIQRGLKSDVNEENDRSRLSPAPPRQTMPNTPILALNGRWLAYCPPTQSSQISLRAHVPVPLIGKAPGVANITAPPIPTPNLATDLPISEGIMNKLMRETTQDIIQGAKWVGQQGKQAWNAYWNKSPNQPQIAARSPPAPLPPWSTPYPPRQDTTQFPPTHGTTSLPATKDPGVVSVADIETLGGSSSIHPVATFAAPFGCSFLSFSPTGMSLFTVSSKGDVQTVWDLSRVQYTKSSPLQQQVLAAPSGGGPRVMQIAQFSRMTVARIVDVAWTKPNGERIAMVTERGTIHLLNMPSSAFIWPPPRRRRDLPESAAASSETPSSAVSIASSALGAALGAARPLMSRPRRSSANSAGFTGSNIVDSASLGGRAIAATISNSLGKTGNAISQLRQTGENRVTLPPSHVLPALGCVAWITRRKHGGTLFASAAGVVRMFPSKSRKNSNRPSRGGMYRDFNVPGIPENVLAETVRHFINGDDEMYLSDRDMDAGNTVTLDARPRIVEPGVGTESAIPQAEIESSAPYQPFHTDRRVSLYAYGERNGPTTMDINLLADLSLDDSASLPQQKKKEKKKGKISFATGGNGLGALNSDPWAFGQSITATKLDLGLPDNIDESLVLTDDHRALPASAMERVLQVGANEEQIVVTTRRRRGARHAEHEDDGFFEDDCEVLDFADQRV